MSEVKTRAAVRWRPVRLLYLSTLFFMALTGFGQMPIYNRYYMTDIPGFGWLADFYVTRNIHYLGAVILLGLAFFSAFDFMLSNRRQMKLSASAWVRVALLAAVIFSGALIVFKNFPYVHLPDSFIIALDLFHLASAMAFLAVNGVCLIAKKKWAVTV
jgi:hypothetical protein